MTTIPTLLNGAGRQPRRVCGPSFGGPSLFFDEWPIDTFMKRVSNDTKAFNLASDVVEYDNKYVIEVDVPGLTHDDIELSFHDGELQINVNRKGEEEQEGAKYLHRSRWSGSASKVFRLGEDVAADQDIDATLADGILTLTINKKPETQPKKIEIKRK